MDDLNESVSLTSVDESQTEAVTNNPDVAKLKEAALARTKLIQEAEDPFSKMLELYDFSEDDTFHLETGDKDIDNIEYARVTLKDDSIGLLNITEKKEDIPCKTYTKSSTYTSDGVEYEKYSNEEGKVLVLKRGEQEWENLS